MGMTIAEKIIADHAGKKEVRPGEVVTVRVDFAFVNDITGPLSIKVIEEIGADKVFDVDRVALIPDHFTPAKDIKSAMQVKMLREFARKFGIKNYFEIGRVGIEHALLPELGLVLPGDIVVGADSHTCTYGALGAFATGMGSTDVAYAMVFGETWLKVPESMKFVYYGKPQKWVSAKDYILYTIGDIGVDGARYRAMEFVGPAIDELSVEGRMTMANMAIEAGGKVGMFNPDEKVEEYVKTRAKRPYKFYRSDEDANYIEVREYDVSKIDPQVAFPHLPENTKSVWEATDIKIDQVVIGSCTNGRIEDLKVAAEILKGRKVHPEVRTIIIPATQTIYQIALKQGLIDVFLEAEAVVSPPTCGPCLGGHMGILAEGERAVSTTNRNFVGRMGHPKSEVYLASPAVAAASAVLGRIAHPEEVLGK